MRRTPRQARRLALVLLLGAAACRRAVPSDARVTFDPELVDREPGRFHQTFDGPPSKLVLGTGWYGLESIEKTGPWSGFSWASSAVTVYFGAVSGGDLELAGRVAPFEYPGSPPQTMTTSLNGTALAAVTLAKDFQEIRVPLPAALLRAPLNQIRLAFAHTARPSKTIASEDARDLSAVFDDLAVVRRGEPLSPGASAMMAAAGASREVMLGSRGVGSPGTELEFAL